MLWDTLSDADFWRTLGVFLLTVPAWVGWFRIVVEDCRQAEKDHEERYEQWKS